MNADTGEYEVAHASEEELNLSPHLLYSFTRSDDSKSSAIASDGTFMVHHARTHANLLLLLRFFRM